MHTIAMIVTVENYKKLVFLHAWKENFWWGNNWLSRRKSAYVYGTRFRFHNEPDLSNMNGCGVNLNQTANSQLIYRDRSASELPFGRDHGAKWLAAKCRSHTSKTSFLFVSTPYFNPTLIVFLCSIQALRFQTLIGRENFVEQVGIALALR